MPYLFLLVGIALIANGIFNKTGELITRPANLPHPLQRVLAVLMGLIFLGFGSLFLYVKL